MFRISRSVLTVSGVILAGGLIAFTNPRTVHALAAALVQVTNTAANPVVTQSVGAQATNLVHLTCSSTASDGACSLAPSPASSTTPQAAFIVPNGQSLVITAVDIYPNAPFWVSGCNLVHQDELVPTGTVQVGTQFWLVYNTSLHMAYPSGMLFPAGTAMYQNLAVYPSNTQPACGQARDLIDLYGYLTAN